MDLFETFWANSSGGFEGHAGLGDSSFISKNRSMAAMTAPYVCLQSSLPAFSSVIIAVSAANLHPCIASLLKFSTISSFLSLCSIPKNMSYETLYLSMHFFSVFHAEPLSRRSHCFCCLERFFSARVCSLVLKSCLFFLSTRFSRPFLGCFLLIPSFLSNSFFLGRHPSSPLYPWNPVKPHSPPRSFSSRRVSETPTLLSPKLHSVLTLFLSSLSLPSFLFRVVSIPSRAPLPNPPVFAASASSLLSLRIFLSSPPLPFFPLFWLSPFLPLTLLLSKIHRLRAVW